MKIKSKTDLFENFDMILTAYHEAGHVVFGLLNNIAITSAGVFINPKIKRAEGFTHYSSLEYKHFKNTKVYNHLVKVDLCLYYSGLVAEETFYKVITGSNNYPMFLQTGSNDDRTSAYELINSENLAEPGPPRLALKKSMLKKTKKQLIDNWDAVIAISHSLLKYKKLSNERIRKILCSKTTNTKFWKEQFKTNSLFFSDIALDESKLSAFLNL